MIPSTNDRFNLVSTMFVVTAPKDWLDEKSQRVWLDAYYKVGSALRQLELELQEIDPDLKVETMP